jgi:ABC-type branched-subunit amino acid transport system substrate-binding protein
MRKLVEQDKIFSMLLSLTWSSASIHTDLAKYKMPMVGGWAYSQTEWQDPWMFPTHMSMLNEAFAGASWVRDVIKPKKFGLICLNSPEMQQACANVNAVLSKAGAKMVKKVDVSLSDTDMSPAVLAFRQAQPDHIIHYAINPAPIAKFMVDAAQQGYYPPKGMSGNHLAAEVLGQLFGQLPVGRYWTNTTYKLWGTDFSAVINKYAPSNQGLNHHIVQAGYVGTEIFAQAAKMAGPNLTRGGLIAALNSQTWQASPSLGQKFMWNASGRNGGNNDAGNKREYMYKYTNTNTTANPDGSPSGFLPDTSKFVIWADAR